jgi:hypothetical protein
MNRPKTLSGSRIEPDNRPDTARRVGMYLRVSTTSKTRRDDVTAFDQDPAVQEQPLRRLIEQRGWRAPRRVRCGSGLAIRPIRPQCQAARNCVGRIPLARD